jgi:uncharacterized protein YbjT (DUF2867 family)
VRIAITGGTGFVGRNVARALLAADHEVVLVARGSRSVAPREGVSVARGDVVSGEGLETGLRGCDAVVHLVAIIREKGKQTFDAVIRRGTENLVSAARAAGVGRIIYVSAIGADPDPRFPYLFAKWSAEHAVRGSGVDFTTLRPSIMFGTGDGFFTTVAGLVRFSIPVIPVAGDGLALFQPISVEDVARCIVLSISRQPAMREIEIGGPEQLTYDEIIDIVHDAIGAGMRIKVHVPVAALLPAAMVMDKVLANPPVTPVQLRMLARHNITRIDSVRSAFGFEPASFRANAGYLSQR